MASACLSSPHLRTHSAQEPPRSVVLLGKRGLEEDAGEPTPASKLRSVRQKTAEGDLPFLLPQPLFTAGGAGAAGRHGYDGHHHQHGGGLHHHHHHHEDIGGRYEGRSLRGGRASKKKPKEPTSSSSRNRRKPARASVRHNKVRASTRHADMSTQGEAFLCDATAVQQRVEGDQAGLQVAFASTQQPRQSPLPLVFLS